MTEFHCIPHVNFYTRNVINTSEVKGLNILTDSLEMATHSLKSQENES